MYCTITIQGRLRGAALLEAAEALEVSGAAAAEAEAEPELEPEPPPASPMQGQFPLREAQGEEA